MLIYFVWLKNMIDENEFRDFLISAFLIIRFVYNI